MINKLRFKFILLSMTSLLTLLTVMVVSMNIINYSSVVRTADSTLSLLSTNKGSFPDFMDGKRFPPDLSPELPYQSRYFSVVLASDGTPLSIDTGKIAAVNNTLAVQYASDIAARGKAFGFKDRFRYRAVSENGQTRITFLDCGRELDSFRSFLVTSSLIAFAGFAIVFFIVFFFAGRIIKPIAESYEKQKRFITDAGHELKTPLTVINANIDLLEMDTGESECIDDMRFQVKRMSALTQNLVLLAKMEETEKSKAFLPFPMSETVLEAASPFSAPARTCGKELICNIRPLITMVGDDKAITQLVCILMDNALKYSRENEKITLELTKTQKGICLSVENTVYEPIPRSELARLFDRFYRTDKSRSSETGGSGIGLSVAKAIVTSHGGKIFASIPAADTFKITAVFPV